MAEPLRENFDAIGLEAAIAVADGRISANPLVRYANDAANIFRGFEMLSHLLQSHGVEREDEVDCPAALTEYEADALLAMMESVSHQMEGEVHHISDQIHRQIKANKGGGDE